MSSHKTGGERRYLDGRYNECTGMCSTGGSGAVPGRGAHVQPVPGPTDSPSQQQEPANFAMDLEEKLGAWNRNASAGQLWLP